MATVNLGAIKFNWKGAYSNSTAYAVDDVVSSGGSSYVCILASQGNAVSNGTYWNIMSSAGTNGTDGTDLTSTLTTQGDLVYRDGSGLQRLGAGTAGQALLTGGAGANPSWGDAGGGKVLQAVSFFDSAVYNTSGTTYVTGGTGVTITPSDTSSKILIMATVTGEINSGRGYYTIFRNSTNVRSSGTDYLVSNQVGGINNPFSLIYLDTPSSTSALTYKVACRSQNSGDTTNVVIPTYIALEIGA